MKTLRLGLTSLAALVALTASARAQVTVQVPFVTVQTGPGGVYVRAPFVTLQVPRSVVVSPAPAPVASAPVEVLPPPQRIGDPIPVPLPKPGQTDFSVPVPVRDVPAATRPLTHREFAATFKPAPGTYDVVLLHPVTNRPVQVSFTLPPGQPRAVRTWPRQLNFDYGSRRDVGIRFLADGRVQVTN
jgi:hypothetical protein